MPRIRKPKPIEYTGTLLIGNICDDGVCRLEVTGYNYFPTALTFSDSASQEVLKITNSGDLYWRGRLIETDTVLKEALLDLHSVLAVRRY